MFDLENNKAGPQVDDIMEWVVWFQTPFGVFITLVEAIHKIQEHELDPNLTIVPVCVAKTKSTYEIWSSR